MELWQNACSELEKIQEIERVWMIICRDPNPCSVCTWKKQGSTFCFCLLKEKDGDLKATSRGMASLQVNERS